MRQPTKKEKKKKKKKKKKNERLPFRQSVSGGEPGRPHESACCKAAFSVLRHCKASIVSAVAASAAYGWRLPLMMLWPANETTAALPKRQNPLTATAILRHVQLHTRVALHLACRKVSLFSRWPFHSGCPQNQITKGYAIGNDWRFISQNSKGVTRLYRRFACNCLKLLKTIFFAAQNN